MKRFLAIIIAGSVGTTALPADAQSPQDWNIFHDTAKKAVVAYSDFDSGISIAVRCVDRTFEALVSGLPEIEAETRQLKIRFPDDTRDHAETWNVATNSAVAISSFPARFARDLREGGRLDIVVPGAAEGGRNLRYVLDLPISNAAIDETLSACNRPLIDPRDAEVEDLGPNGLPGGLEWAQRPRPRYPNTDYVRGFAVLTCLNNPDGTLRDCIVETEHPQNGYFGVAALRGVRGARVQSTEDASAALSTRFISFRNNFYLSGYEPRRPRDRPHPSIED